MTNRVGQRLGSYQLVRILGRGGFAEVYLGEHVHLGTTAAIKVLQTQLAREEQEHFLAEARLVARLRHPNIIRVLDFGLEDAVPFLVIEYAAGGSLRERYPKGSCLSAYEILPSVKQITAALQYAHDQQVIHRDVKPENMLLGQHDEVLLSDFGIALLTRSVRAQRTQEVVGTAAYMAPEQIQGKPQPASDQYSLGIVIYEWLCGSVPFQGSFTEQCSQYLFAPPPPLHDKIPDISPAIAAVVEKALAKDPHQRFPTVQELTSAFEEACKEEQPTVSALPPTVRRHASFAPTRYPNGTPPATTPPVDIVPLPATQPVPAVQEEAGELPAIPPSTSVASRGLSRRVVLVGLGGSGLVVVGGLSWFLLNQHSRSSSSSSARFTAPPSPSTSSHPLGTTLLTYHGHTGAVYAAAWSPNGQYMASGSGDTTVRVWNTSTGDTLTTYHGHSGLFNAVFSIGWSPHESLIASGGADKTVQVWDAATGNRLTLYSEHTARVLAVAWSLDAKYVASGGADTTVRVWEALSGKYALLYQGHTDTVYTVAWSPTGTLLASGGADKTVQVWEAQTGKHLFTYRGHAGLGNIVSAAAWSPDGKRIASGSTDKTVQVWDAPLGTQVYTYHGHKDTVYTVAWVPQGPYLASGSADTSVKIWQAIGK